MWPAPGLHKIRALGKGSQFLELDQDWSDRLGAGETEHVTDIDAAWAMTWGKIAGVLNAMAKEKFTGATVEAAQAAAWAAFKSRLPEALGPRAMRRPPRRRRRSGAPTTRRRSSASS